MNTKKPETLYNSPEKSPSEGRFSSRRAFLQYGTAAAAYALISGCSRTTEPHIPTPEEHSSWLQKERSHAFYGDPRAWLKQNARAFPNAFDVSGKSVQEIDEYCIDEGIVVPAAPGIRIRRTPGSNILTAEDEHLANIKEHLILTAQEEHHAVPYIAHSHESCGACKVYIQQENLGGHPDDHGKEEIIDRVNKLKALGVDARYGRHVPLKELKRPADRHPASMAIIDGTAGRLHDHRRAGFPDSYVISSHDELEIKNGIEIVLAIANGAHGYGTVLDRFTFVAFRDKQHPEIADAIEAAVDAVKAGDKGSLLDVQYADAPHA